MKKIIALAVAGAFTAPVMAADVTISGVVEYQYRDVDGATTTAHNGDTPAFTVSATSETNFGSVTGKITWDGDFDDDQLIMDVNNFGSIAVGNPDSALDAQGDWTDVAPEKGGFRGDGGDTFMTIKPNLGINGLSVAISTQPATSQDGTGQGEGSAYGLTYDMGNMSVYAGSQKRKGYHAAANDTTETLTAFGIKASFGPLYLAAESAQLKNTGADSTEAKFTGIAATYQIEDVTIGVEQQDSDGAYDQISFTAAAHTTVAQFDETTVFIKYSFGGGLTGYIEQYDESKAGGEQTTMGLQYSF